MRFWFSPVTFPRTQYINHIHVHVMGICTQRLQWYWSMEYHCTAVQYRFLVLVRRPSHWNLETTGTRFIAISIIKFDPFVLGHLFIALIASMSRLAFSCSRSISSLSVVYYSKTKEWRPYKCVHESAVMAVCASWCVGNATKPNFPAGDMFWCYGATPWITCRDAILMLFRNISSYSTAIQLRVACDGKASWSWILSNSNSSTFEDSINLHCE